MSCSANFIRTMEISQRYLCTEWDMVSTFEVRKSLISSSSLKIIENTQLLHECKQDRDENLRQVLLEAQNENNIDPILIADYHEQGKNIEEDDPEQLL